MANAKIAELDALTTPVGADLLAIVDDVVGTPITKKVTLSNILSVIYPIGAVYTSVASTSPATLFGGTWSVFGAGKVPVGIDSGDADFDTTEKTGGSKTHTLTTAQLASHRHAPKGDDEQNRFVVARRTPSNQGAAAGTSGSYWSGNSSASAYTKNAGSGDAHNNVQPYIVVYMWKRTA